MMTKGQIIGLSLATVGTGLFVYYGFIYKFQSWQGQTMWQHLISDVTSKPNVAVPGNDGGIVPPFKPSSVTSVPGIPAIPSTSVPGVSAVYSTGDTVRIRKAPSLTGDIIGTVNKGQKAGYLAPGSTADWISIRSPLAPSSPAYISSQYAKVDA